MRILAHFYSSEALHEAQSRLEKAGIPVVVEFHHGMQSRRLGPQHTLLVVVDEHFKDAEALLKKPHHVVMNPIDVAAFKQHANQHLRGGKDLAVILKIVALTAIGLLALLFLLASMQSSD